MPPGSSPAAGPGVRFRDLILDDIRHGKLYDAYRRDIRDIYRFYLSDEQRERLAGMRAIKRFFWITGWLLLNLLLRLTPPRRILLLVSAVLFAVRPRFESQHLRLDLDFSQLAFFLLLLVLMLELKDKLLARDEIEVARQVQLSLLPKGHPAVPGWEVWSATTPANDVGGDLIDYLEGGGGRTGLALGDVSGKGMGAALLCAKLQATLRALAPGASDLEALGASLNTILERAGLDNRYATLFYAEISGSSPEVRFLNAGHNPALIVRDGRVSELTASSLPLGMLPSASYRQGTDMLGPGDVLILYSDGITEQRNRDEDEFGMPRLTDVIRGGAGSAEALARRVLDAAHRFAGGEKPHDDQSILVLRRTQA